MTQNETLTGTLLLVAVAIVLLPLLAMGFLMPTMGMWGPAHTPGAGMWGAGGGSWAWLAMWLLTLLVVAGAGFLLYTRLGRGDGEPADAAVEELRLAYARGDLSDEEFERRRERLGESE